MNNNRSWMYERIDDRGFLNSLFISGVEEFMNHAISQPTSMGGTSIQCPGIGWFWLGFDGVCCF